MKNAMMKLVLSWCFIIASCSAAYANSITGFQSGWWWQAAGYAGLGNANEDLAFAEYYTTANNAEVTVSFNLLGEYANYVNRVCVYARKYDPSTDGNASKVAKTFERVWDYRDPTGKVGAVLLAQTTDVKQAMSLKGTVAEAGAYVLYVTADINSKAKDGSELPMIGGPRKNLTKIGAEITNLDGGSLGYIYNDYYKEFRYNGNQALLEQGNYDASGKRALAIQNRVIFAPNDFYSKYYRIPAIVSTSDGSLLSVSDARKKHIHDITNDIDIILRRSIDNGHSWSQPTTIAKGEGKYKADGTLDCLNSIGYGDPAFASLPNGDILCAFTHGYGLGITDASKKTYNSYSISRDNGQTWSTPEYLCDKDGNKLSIIENERGNIAPGNMCVVKSGLLAGKVIACFRSFKYTSGWYYTNGNYFLVYDPSANYWQILKPKAAASYSSMFKSSNGSDDEAQLIEVGENKFLMSIRTSGTGQRQFVMLTMSSSNGEVRWNAQNLGQCGMNLKEKANGAMTSFTTKDGKEYLLHTVPTTQASASAGAAPTTRSGLCIFYVRKSDAASGRRFTWTKSLCISDPNDYLDETAQYSSLTVQQDGTVGILYEGYPQIIRITADQVDEDGNCAQGGDYLMRSIYMNLRIGDIIDGAQRSEQLPLQPPVVTPGTSTYDTNKPTDRPNIVITNPNDLQKTESKVDYNLQIFNEKNVLVAEKSVGCEFGTESVTLKWSDLTTNDGTPFATAVKNNYTVRVNAKCFTGNTTYISPSAITSQMYYFRTPTRLIRIVAKPGDNNGDPSITANGVQADKGVTITAGVGDKVTVQSGHNRAPYEFLYFTSDYAGHKRQYFDPAFKAVSDNPSQYSITMPSEQDFPDNDGGCITIYAVYNQGQIGVMTYTATNYFNSAHNTYSGYHMYRHPYYSQWSSLDGFSGQGGTLYNDAYAQPSDSVWVWPTASADLNLNDGSDAQNVSIANRLTYPAEYEKNGLDLRARLMSDKSTFENYTAVVMLYNESEGRFMYRSEMNKQQRAMGRDSVYAYYVVNGRSAQFSQGSDIAENALGVRQWYNGTLPAVTDYMDFEDVLASDGSDGTPTLRVVYFLIYKTGSEDFTVADLTKGSNFAIKVEQTIVADKMMTGINATSGGNGGLQIVGRNGSATFSSGDSMMVTVHNVLGQQMARFELNGSESKTIELPSGVYVAGGQKFIVK